MLKRFIEDEIYGESFTLYVLSNAHDKKRLDFIYDGTLGSVIKSACAFVARGEQYGEEFEILVLCPEHDNTSLVHEVIHHATHTFKQAGILIEHGNDEAFAYYVEYILRKCYKAISIDNKTGTRSKNPHKGRK